MSLTFSTRPIRALIPGLVAFWVNLPMLCAPQAAAQDHPTHPYATDIAPLLNDYCVHCHSGDTAEANVRLDLLNADFSNQQLFVWERVVEQLQTEAMPPAEDEQPTRAERKKLIDSIRSAIGAAVAATPQKNGVARRLTVAQYRNTLRDLLGIEDQVADVLPPDGVSQDGFVNNVAVLGLTPLQLEYYFEIADRALDRCIVDPQQLPQIQSFRVELGTQINQAPCPDELILGANSRLLNNEDFVVTEFAAAKDFAYTPKAMLDSFKFHEGYQGNNTVRGWQTFDSIYHAVFACMRGGSGYPKGEAYEVVPEGLLLRPSPPSSQRWGEGSTFGPNPNFKIALRELPEQGNFRVRVRAARFADAMLLDAQTSLPSSLPPSSTQSTEVLLPTPPRLTDGGANNVSQGDVVESNLANNAAENAAKNVAKNVYENAAKNVAKEKKSAKVKVPDGKQEQPDAERVLQTEVTLPQSGIYRVDVVHLTSAPTAAPGDSELSDGERKRLSSESRRIRVSIDQLNIAHHLILPRQADERSREEQNNGSSARTRDGAAHATTAAAAYQSAGLAVVRLSAGKHAVQFQAGQGLQPHKLIFTQVLEASELGQQFVIYEQRAPLLSVYLGLRRDCGHTLLPVSEPQPVTDPQLLTYEFSGAISNFPLPRVDSDNDNYLAGIREIGVRSVATDDRDRPRLLIKAIEFEGPYYESWPPANHRAIFVDSQHPAQSPAYAREIIEHFMNRAYRRAVESQEVDLIYQVWQHSFEHGQNFEQSIKEALTVVLTSPQFLFLIERSHSLEPEQLAPYELASKLAYFLWNTAPDAQLLAASANNQLAQQLPQEVERLLADPRSRQFVEQFVSQWLSLEKLDLVETDIKKYPNLSGLVKAQLRQEPVRFMEYLIANNLPLENLVDSDFLLSNETLATYYQLKTPLESGFEFQAVPHSSSHLGGILSQAGILAALSDGRESNPVKRGAWFARKMIADPPDPPPPNVPELQEAVDEQISLRERLEQHRDQPGCANCHRGIDPWGLPFESYDAGGLWKDEKVDAAALLPTGRSIADVQELKRYLLQEHFDRVAFSFLKHLATYAVGRDLSYRELREIENQMVSLKTDGYPLRDCIQWIVASDLFLEK